jgi:hypothetical protein
MPLKVGTVGYSGTVASHYLDIKNSNSKIIRWGGKAIDANATFTTSLDDYINKIQEMRDNLGTDVIVQLPYNPNDMGASYTADLSGAAKQAYDIVVKIQTVFAANPIKYWTIGNELDGAPHYLTANDIAGVVRAYSPQIRAANIYANNHNPVIIIAPSLSYYRDWDGMVSSLCSAPSTTNTVSILGSDPTYGRYIDMFAFHIYALGHEAIFNKDIPAPNRFNAINVLTQNVTTPSGGNNIPFYTNLTNLKTKLFATGQGIAITEANICYGNDVHATDLNYVQSSVAPYTTQAGIDQTDDSPSGNGANSFIGIYA